LRIRYALPARTVSGPVLNAALETSVRANQALLEDDDTLRLPSEAISAGDIRWRPEPFRDGEHFDLLPEILKRGWGDCDDIAPAIAAELRALGRDPGARSVAKKSGPNRWHAVVQLSDGRIWDPSRWAGMGKPKGIKGNGIQQRMALSGSVLGIALTPWGYASRCDLPMSHARAAISGHALADTPEDALSDAIDAAVCCGDSSERVPHDSLTRAEMIRAAWTGDEDDIADLAGDDEVGFLPLAAALAPTALSMASKLIPGSSGKKKGSGSAAPMPSPDTARQVSAVPAGGGTPVTVTPYAPGGPIIVRF
jgi:hypothetical protein